VFVGYPIEATEGNWLHECLSSMVRSVHESLDCDQPVPDWPEIIPIEYRERLKHRTGLKDRFQKYQTVVTRLGAKNRRRIQRALADQNGIAVLVACGGDCEALGDLPKSIRKPIEELFGFAFRLLTNLGIRDEHYRAIYSAQEDHVCPFCGCEYFDAPSAPRQDLDHYLPRRLYPFAAANLRNLVPMGKRCNESYKGDTDILRKPDGTRRRAFDPYADRNIKVALDDSAPFGGAGGRIPEWKIELHPESPECETWDEVFHVRERLERDALTSSFEQWLGQFAKWFVSERGINDLNDDKIADGVRAYADILEIMGFEAKVFLKEPVFRMLQFHCAQGHARLLSFMRELVTQAVPPPAG
jgi:hypothetical protein